MELKKTSSADLENKKGLFLEIGLAISLLLIIGVFSWNQKEKVIKDFAPPAAVFDEEMVDITVQEEKKIEIPVRTLTATTDILEVVRNDAAITTDFDFSTDFTDAPVEIVQPKAREEAIAPENVPVLRAEQMPTFQGGDLNKFRDWVQSNVEYPPIAEANNIQGTVTITFVVNTAGEVVDVEVLSSPDQLLSNAALRTVRSSPKWTPGMQRNRPQAVKMSMPVQFVLR